VSRRWFADPTDEATLGATLVRLVRDVSRMLDRLEPAPVAPGVAWIDPQASAVVLPHGQVPGCSLVVQVAEWSSSIGCWWATGADPLAGPATSELFAEFPLRPDGHGQAVAWLERELRRPVVERVGRYGVARRRRWAVVMDDGYELPVGHQWQSGSGGAARGPAGSGGADPGPTGSGEGRWLLVVAVGAAVLHWVLNLAGPLLGAGAWLRPASALDVLAFAALFVWFGVAGLDRPARLRVPVLAGLLLATLGQAWGLLVASPDELPSAADSVPELLGRYLADWLPRLFGVAALACYLVAFLALPRREGSRPAWPRPLPVAAGLAWGLDLAVGLTWLARVEPTEGVGTTLAWYGLLQSVLQAAALGLALVLLFVLLDRRQGMARRPAQASLAGGVLLVVASSALVHTLVAFLAPLLPTILAFALLDAAFSVTWFAGTALLTVAAEETPATPTSPAAPASAGGAVR
jgi:hypothetical protein